VSSTLAVVQRFLIIGLALVIGGWAIVSAIQELNKKPDVIPASDPQEIAGPARTVVVRMDDIAYNPDVVSARLGQTVRWVNDDDVTHTVAKVSGPDEDFQSDDIKPGQSFDFTLGSGQGVIEYQCENHPDRMRGEISVIGD
jgi:plastocyanin